MMMFQGSRMMYNYMVYYINTIGWIDDYGNRKSVLQIGRSEVGHLSS